MGLKVFATGATGYIGGDALHEIVNAHPEYEIACLVRNSDKGAQVASQYAKIRLVYGDLDSAEILEEEAKNADVVLNCASADHEGAAKALTKGLAAHSENRPGYLIHTSGTGILTFADYERKTFGEAANKVYDDWDGVKEVTSLPDFAFHRNIDKIVLEAGTTNPNNIKTAIVCPPTIYGTGRGPGNQRSIQLPDLAKATLTEKKGFKVGEGLTYWANVHVFDLSKLYLKLLEAAASGGGKATWGKDGYYFTEHGEHIWGEISQAVASAAHKQGFLPDDEVISISPEKSTEFHRAGPVLWGANSRGRAIRARKLLGWSPQEASIAKEAPIAVAIEAKSLGLVEGHAAKVAG